MKIRKVKETDAENFLELNKKLDSETQFLLFEPNERQTTISQQKNSIEKFESNGIIIFVLEYKGELVGFIGGTRQNILRTNHILKISIGILQEYTKKGYGRKLLDEIENWAAKNAIYRIELTVRVDNYNAIKLYKKKGFKLEGTKKKSLRINNEYFDEYYMYKLLEE